MYTAVCDVGDEVPRVAIAALARAFHGRFTDDPWGATPEREIQGDPPYRRFRARGSLHRVPTFLLSHSHPPDECPFAFAAWRGFDSPLRHRLALSSCLQGGHALWWVVDAETEQDALGQLPHYLSERSEVTRVRSVPIP